MKLSEKERLEKKVGRRFWGINFIDVKGKRYFKKVKLVNNVKRKWEDKWKIRCKMIVGFIKVEFISGVIRGWKFLDVMFNKFGYDVLEWVRILFMK